MLMSVYVKQKKNKIKKKKNLQKKRKKENY